MGGIQGSLNKQFAMTIAISVLISAFNALTLSPALAAMWLRPRKHRRLLGGFFGGFNRGVRPRRRTATSRVSRALIRKAVVGIAILAGFAVLAGGLGRRLPTSFVPEEDYGYFLLNVQLPPAASLQRTDDVCRKVEAILDEDRRARGVQRDRRLQPADPRHGAEQRLLLRRPEAVGRARAGLDARSIVNRAERDVPRRRFPKASALAVMPPAIPGLGSQGGFSFWLQDRIGRHRSTTSTQRCRSSSPRRASGPSSPA